MIIQNARVFDAQGDFIQRDIHIEGDRFVSHAQGGETINAQGLYAIPGLVDVHLHGCMRYDYSSADAEGLQVMSLYQARNGVTSLCPALMTLPEKELEQAARRCADYEGPGAEVVGINLEGPFLSPENAGAQNPRHMLDADIALFDRLQAAARGRVKLLSIAPELSGAMPLIKALHDKVHLSIAHTKADYDTTKEALEQGADHITHLFNAMPPLLHRAPGVIGAAFEHPGVFAELICDGIHIHPVSVRAALRLFGEERIVFVSDSMMATGLGDGDYVLGDLPVTVIGRKATLTDGSSIAGSATNLMDCLRVAVQRMDVPLHTAVRCASINPARSIGVDDQYGSIEAGKKAHLVLLRPDLSIERVILNGNAFA